MKRQKVWDFYATFYEQLFTQRISLKPTRDLTTNFIKSTLTNSSKRMISILDCGCGTGQQIDELNKKFPNIAIDGFDLSPSMISQTKAKFLKQSNIKITNTDINDFHPNKHYDFVICSHAYPYMGEIENVLSKLHSFCKPKGYLILAAACTNNLYDRIILYCLDKVSSQANYPSSADMIEFLKRGGFKLVKFKHIKKTKLAPTIYWLAAQKL